MKDERMELGFLKIRAELCSIIYLFLAFSLCVKVFVFGMSGKECFPEMAVLVFTPIYQLVRQRQLDLSGYELLKKQSTAKRPLVCVVVAGVVALAAYWRFQQVGSAADPKESIVFFVAFVASFVAARLVYLRYEKKRKEELDHRYDD